MQLFYTTGTVPPYSTLQQTSCPSTVGNILHRTYNFGAGTNDNGNVLTETNCRDTNRTQNFAYDSLNRIQQAYTTGTNWGEAYTIDAWGNLTNISPVSGKTNYEGFNAAPASIKNQLNGYCHDSAGNLVLNSTCPTGTFTPTYSYDAENRLARTAGWTYTYDGDGRRLMKCNGSACTLYWTGTGSDPLAESNGATFAEEYIFFNGRRIARRDLPGGAVNYYFSDHLGSASVITNSTGSVEKESDYYPYGGEIPVSGSDINHYKFTAKERDSESNLDEFGARYYASSLARFMMPDWAEKPTAVPYAYFGDPQSLNLYSYVRNNPLAKGDADGHCGEDLCIVEGGAAIYIGGAALLAGTAAYLATPSGQRSLSTFTSAASQSISDSIHAVGNFFHPDNGGQVPSSPPPSVPTQNVPEGTPASTSQQGAVNTNPMPLIVVSPGGDAIPVPNGASGPVPVVNPQGNTTGVGDMGGSGGNGLDPRVSDVRVMDPTPARGASPGYPNGYVSYGNSSGQGVNPQTGQTVPNSDPSRHIPLSPPKPCPSGGSCS